MTDDNAKLVLSELRLLNKQVSELTIALEGDTRLGIEGIVKRVDRHDKWINSMNLKVAKWSGAGAVIAVGGIKLIAILFGTHIL